MDIIHHWKQVRQLINASLQSSKHSAIASVDENGEPHITPIGSLILTTPGNGYYLEKFTKQLSKNLKSNNHICVLAVNSSLWFWIKSLISGRFNSPPGVRLYGVVGDLRQASKSEINLFLTNVKPFKFSRGYKKLWMDMSMLREIHFTRIEPVVIADMTKNNWL